MLLSSVLGLKFEQPTHFLDQLERWEMKTLEIDRKESRVFRRCAGLREECIEAKEKTKNYNQIVCLLLLLNVLGFDFGQLIYFLERSELWEMKRFEIDGKESRVPRRTQESASRQKKRSRIMYKLFLVVVNHIRLRVWVTAVVSWSKQNHRRRPDYRSTVKRNRVSKK